MCVPGTCREQKKASFGSSRTEVTDACEHHVGPLEEKAVLLTEVISSAPFKMLC